MTMTSTVRRIRLIGLIIVGVPWQIDTEDHWVGNPNVAGSNPAPATIDGEGLADVASANPFALPRLPLFRAAHTLGQPDPSNVVWLDRVKSFANLSKHANSGGSDLEPVLTYDGFDLLPASASLAHYNGHLVRRRGRIRGVSPWRK